ncbi:MAG: M48 family metallopeptidase [Clostridia bacterium]|nr:M48 family metallopeptidase [Clostridia bacterium]
MDWKVFMLVLLTAERAFLLLKQIVQYRSANNPTPANLADVYDAQTYQQWKRYSAEKCRLDIVSTLISYGLMLVLLSLDVHAKVAGLFPGGVYVQLIAVLVFQTLVDSLVSVGLNYVETMVIEEKYGFNRSSMKTFVMDQIRSFLLEVLLSVGMMSALAALHLAMGDWVVVLFTGVLFAFTLVMSFLYPIFSRLGNKFTPLEEGELKDKLTALLTKHGYHVKAIEVMDASRRTTKSNAYFTGFGRMKTIVLFDNLLSTMSTDEICAVFAHELGHGLHKDVLKKQAMNIINLFAMAALVWLTVREPALHQAFGFGGVNYGFAFILLGFELGLVQPVLGMVMNAYSRYAEYRADRQAVAEGYGEALVSGLKKLARGNFAHLAPSPLLVVLEYSHPPLGARIKAIQQGT